MMDAIKLMLSGIMLMLTAIFLALMGAEICLFLAVIGVILFIIGVFQRTDDTPLSLDKLPQKTCAACGKEYDFDYAACPHCGHTDEK